MTHAGIRLTPEGAADAWVLSQNRPRIAESLAGLDLSNALARIPLLLPICAVAQLGAATAAVDAATGQNAGVDSSCGEHSSYDGLLREQGIAHAWRWLVTWPPLLGDQPDLVCLRDIRAASDDKQLSLMLQACVVGLDEVSSLESLARWASAEHCTAARLFHLMLGDGSLLRGSRPGAAEKAAAVSVDFLDREMIYNGIRAAFVEDDVEARARLDGVLATAPATQEIRPLEQPGQGPATVPAGSESAPCYVGPLAARGHSLTETLASHPDIGLLAKMLIAQLLDGIVVMRALATDCAAQISAWSIGLPGGDALGIGSAMTSRGPLFHLVRQNARDKARGVAGSWQILAPTDWHFKDGNLLQHLLPGNASAPAVRMALAALDPCCAADVRSASIAASV